MLAWPVLPRVMAFGSMLLVLWDFIWHLNTGTWKSDTWHCK